MIWEDEGFLLSKNNFDENSIIIEAFTLNYGKYAGIVYGGSSRKQKKIFQIGNKMTFNLKSKNESKIGYFNSELIKPVAPLFFDDKKRTICIFAASNLLKILLPERQSNRKIYYAFDKFIENIINKNWIINYIFWELSLIKELGFEINFFKSRDSKKSFNDKIYINNNCYKIPKIILNNENREDTNYNIRDALIFNKNLLLENFIIPNRLKMPTSRNILEKYYN